MKKPANQSRREKDKHEGRRSLSHLDLRTRLALHVRAMRRRLLVDAAVPAADSDSAVVMVVVRRRHSRERLEMSLYDPQTGYHVSGYSRLGRGSVCLVPGNPG